MGHARGLRQRFAAQRIPAAMSALGIPAEANQDDDEDTPLKSSRHAPVVSADASVTTLTLWSLVHCAPATL